MLKKTYDWAIFTAVGIAVLEILTRLLVPADASLLKLPRWQNQGAVRSGWTPRWHGNINIEGVGGQKGSYELRINPFGFRGASMRTARKPAETVRIFFMGGSFVESLALPEEKTFPAQIEQRLSAAHPGTHYECVNAGLSGFMARDLVAQLKYSLLNYAPDILVVTVPAVNDLRYGTLPEFDPAHPASPPSKPEPHGWVRSSRFLSLAVRLTGRFLRAHVPYSFALDHLRRDYQSVPKTTLAESHALPDFQAQLEALIRLAQENHIRLVLTSEPSIYQTPLPPQIENQLWLGLMRKNLNLSPEFLEKETRRFNQAAEMLAHESDVVWIDLAGQIPKTLDHFYDDMHLTPAGAKKTADALIARLRI